MSRPIRWGILGPGRIAAAFAAGLQALPDADLAAVGSRSRERADAFADRFGIPVRHGSYEDLAADPGVDIVYVATPHPGHAPAMRLCLAHGKAVLSEKPFTVNAAEAREVVGMARSRRLLLMEGMWTRYWPLMRRLRSMVADGAIGEPLLVQADFGFRATFDPESRLFSPSLGGGALLDVGVYCVSLASMLFGKPRGVVGEAVLGQTGVDEHDVIALSYDGGAMALLGTSVRVSTAQEAIVTGTEGRIRVHAPWWQPSVLTLSAGGAEETIELPREGNGFNYEAAEAMACLRDGRTETDGLPLDETVHVMETMDRLREQWGVRYPMESAAV